MIFEVLSASTERYEKRLNSQRLSSLDAYVLIEQARMAVTVYRRTGGDWTAEFLSPPSAWLDLSAIGCVLSLALLYERTLLDR